MLNATFLLSGPFETATKNELAAKIREHGGEAIVVQYRLGFFAKKNLPLPNYVVSNQTANPVKRKVKDAIEFGVPIITEQQLLEMLKS